MDSPFSADRQYCVLLMMMTLGSMGMGVGCVGWGWDAVWPLSWVPEAVCGVLPSPGPELTEDISPVVLAHQNRPRHTV